MPSGRVEVVLIQKSTEKSAAPKLVGLANETVSPDPSKTKP
jgi:hypothetical protein